MVQLEKQKARLEIKGAHLEDQIEELRAINTNGMVQEEKNIVQQRIEKLTKELDSNRANILNLADVIKRKRLELGSQPGANPDVDARRMAIEEELEFLKQVHEQEMHELQQLALQDIKGGSKEFWTNEMGNAMREIQAGYEDKKQALNDELQNVGNVKVTV